MTGKYPARLQITDWIGGGQSGKLLPAPYLHQLPLGEVTIARALKEAGYVTGHFGKWHLGAKGFLPEDHGFDASFGAGNGAGHPPSYFFPYAPKNNPKAGIISDGQPGEYLTDRLTDEALRFIETNQDKPFFLYLPHYAVHTPLMAKDDIVARYRAKKLTLVADRPHMVKEMTPGGEIEVNHTQDNAIYAAMIESLDQSVGRVMAKLVELKLEANTIVIFTSDNGGLSTVQGAPTSNLPLRAGKGWLYEGGIREPLIVRWPGKIAAGVVCDRVMISNDFFPTLLELSGLTLQPARHMDAVSFASTLLGKSQPDRGPVFWHYPHYHTPKGAFPGGAVRVGDFKLIEWYEDMRVELFNLKDDLGEQHDLSQKMPEKTAELKTLLHDWRASVHATMPSPNPQHAQGADVGKD